MADSDVVYAMTHDPLCPVIGSSAETYWLPNCPNCDLIARVREDERAAEPCIAPCAASNYERGRADALAEARDAVAAVDGGYSVPPEMPVGAFIDAMRREFLAAIDALEKP